MKNLRQQRLRLSFSHYIADISNNEDFPIRPRCRAGIVMEIAARPVDEDEGKLEDFDERVLHNALTFKESGEPVPLPEWLDEEQPCTDAERRKRRKDRWKKKRKKKRKREGQVTQLKAEMIAYTILMYVS